MNNSPFEIFRRNLKPLMVLLTALALFAFVVLPVVDSYMRQNAGSGGDAVVARYDGKSLTRNRVDYFTRNHHDTVQFLAKLADATIQRGGIPKTAGFQYDPQSKRVISLGINQNPGAEVSVRTMMFAEQARKSGFELDDNAIRSWLDRFTDGMVSDNDITAMLMAETQNRMGRPHLYEQLRNHLLADVYLKRGYAGLYSGDNPSAGALLTPSEQWEAFVKLNRSANVDAYGVLVNDYLDQTDANPPEDVVLATYEEGKLRDVNDQSPDPAFHRRYTASFEYLVGDMNTFIKEEVAKLKEEDIRAEYERRLAGGEFQLPDEALEKALKGSDSAADSEATEDADPAADKPDDDADDSSDDSSGPETDSEGDSETKASDNESPDESTDTEQDEGAEESADASEPDINESTEEPAALDEQAAADEQASIARERAVQLVALQEETEAAGGDAVESEAAEPASASSDDTADADQSETEDSVAEEPSTDSGDETSEDQDENSDSKSGEGDKQDENGADDVATKTEGEEKEGDQPADDEPKVESFEDVRERLAEQMAFPAARQRLDEAAKQVYKRMQAYFTEKAIYDSNVEVGQAGDPPERPDLEALAKEVGFEFKAIGPYDQVSIADEPISTSMDAATQFGGRGPNFALMMYGYVLGQNQVEPRGKFSPIQTTEFMSGKTYVSWKTDDREAYTPTLDEVMDEVVEYVRMKEARGLAEAAAEDLAKQAAVSDKSLSELIPEDKQDNLNEGLGPFKWLDSIGRGVTMGNVPELDSVGDDFMAAVFESEVGEYHVAANQPERVYYIVKPTKFEPELDELRQRFREPSNRRNLTAIDAGIGSILGEFYESVDKQAGFADLTVTEQ